MTTSPNSPKLLKGGIVVLEPGGTTVQRVISLQYNPDTLTRSIAPQWYSGQQEADGEKRMRFKGPAQETIKLEAVIDATDHLEFPNQFPTAIELGIHPQLAALETLVYPTSRELIDQNDRANSGIMEIVPPESPLTVFVWSKSRIAPVRMTEFSITEEFFDPDLNPIRAKVSLGMTVLTVDDLRHSHPGGKLFMAYLQNKEALARRSLKGDFASLGISGLPL
jgi:hypothetical protein